MKLSWVFFMNHFKYIDETLHVEDVSIDFIANSVGTPFYVYSTSTIVENYLEFESALTPLNSSIYFAMKANSNLAILKTLKQLGAGMDVVSIGEYLRAQAVGIPGDKIVFSGVGKTQDEIKTVLHRGIKQFNVESEPELDAINTVAKSIGKIAPISIRVNPDVDAKTHEKISTGKLENKFGIPISTVREFCNNLAKYSYVNLLGLDIHIGSQLTKLLPYRQAFNKIATLTKTLREDGHQIKRLDLGGGIGIPYHSGQKVINCDEYSKLIQETLGHLNCEFEFEPGRLIVGSAGLLVCSVIYLKRGTAKNFLILDGAMNDFIRPCLYNAEHQLMCVKKPTGNAEGLLVDVVGPVCETGDTFSRSVAVPILGTGDLVSFSSAGAYGAVMSSEYNSRPLVPEVLVKGRDFTTIRKRPSVQEIINRDLIPDWL